MKRRFSTYWGVLLSALGLCLGASSASAQLSLRDCDFAEYNAFIAEGLQQHPGADRDSLSYVFLEDRFGPAEPYIDYYLRLRRKVFEYSRTKPESDASPLTLNSSMLSPKMRARYNELFDKAEDAVHSDSLLLARVRTARLPLQFCELEIMRTEGLGAGRTGDVALALFEERCRDFRVTQVSEDQGSIQEYCELYRRRWLGATTANLSYGKMVITASRPEDFDAEASALTDGLFGGYDPAEGGWVGWEGADGDLTLDLGSEKAIKAATADFLYNPGKKVFLPLRVGFSTSLDGKRFTPWTTLDVPPEEAQTPRFVPVEARSGKTPLRARYVRVHITSTLACADGSASWLLLDEITIQ